MNKISALAIPIIFLASCSGESEPVESAWSKAYDKQIQMDREYGSKVRLEGNTVYRPKRSLRKIRKPIRSLYAEDWIDLCSKITGTTERFHQLALDLAFKNFFKNEI